MTITRGTDNQSGWNGNGSPWWLKAISTVGPVAAIALYLVYWMTTAVPTRADVALLGTQLKIHVDSTVSDLTEIKRILTAQCVNDAKDGEQRLRCLGEIPVK